MKQRYKPVRFRQESINRLHTINTIIEEYENQGFVLTVRQLYYQLVARDYIPNNERSYKQLISLVTDGRMAGLIDWDMIEDRTRSFIRRSGWYSPAQIVRACANQFHMHMWENQPRRVYVIVEKEALVSVFQRVCHKYDVPLLAARGYPSMSVLRDFAETDLVPAREAGQDIVLFHFGDHDPSGIDMSRDLIDRLSVFLGSDDWNLERLALNYDQVLEKRPPPNPAKTTDIRFKAYARQFKTNSSWELDSLPPTYLEKLASDAIEEVIEWDLWEKTTTKISDGRTKISEVADQLEA